MIAFRHGFLVLLSPALSVAQLMSFGVTAGVPISPQSQRFPDGFLLNGMTGPNELAVKPWLAGAAVQFRLYRKFSAVGEFQYERIHEDFTYSSVKFQVNFGTRGGTSASAWLFPLLIRYDLKRGRLSPFFDAGITLLRLGTLEGDGYQLDFYLNPQPTSFHIDPGGNSRSRSRRARGSGRDSSRLTYCLRSVSFTGRAATTIRSTTRRS